MLSQVFYRWERKLASVDNNRIVRPFEWGEDWLPEDGLATHEDASLRVQGYVDRVMEDTRAWYAVEPAREYGTAPWRPTRAPGSG